MTAQEIKENAKKNLEFGNEDIANAIKEQVDKYCFVGSSYAAEPKVTLAKMIIGLGYCILM